MSNFEYERPVHPVKPSQTIREQDLSLKGTLFSVLLLGGFIVISWVGVFLLFLSRN